MSIIKDIFSGGTEGLFGGLTKMVGAFKADPTEVAKLQIELARIQADIEGKLLAADTAVVAAINQTMQVEAKSEHWLQWSWRPVFGMTGAGILVNNYILLPYLVNYGVVPITVPTEVWLMIMAVLGVSAYTRGLEKITKLKA